MNDTRLYLVRHGEVEKLNEVIYGQLDLPLSGTGRAQMEAVAVALRHVDLAAIYGSDLQRAAWGAAQIAAGRRATAVLSPALREMRLGKLEGLTFREAKAKHPELTGRAYSTMVDFAMPEDGESIRDVAARAVPFVRELLATHAGGRIAIVAHNTVNRVVLADALGLPLENCFGFAQHFGAISVIDFRKTGPYVRLINAEAGHLREGCLT